MLEMVERVARAIRSGMEASGMANVQANGPNGEAALQQFFEVLAMDAIEAMREPTEEIIAAGYTVETFGDGVTNPAKAWPAMIDAALK